MTRIAFFKKYAPQFAAALVMLGLIVYTLGHALSSSANSLLTSPLRTVTDRRITSAEAYLFREEEVLVAEGDMGLIDTLVESGTKVSKNTPLVDVYPATALSLSDQVTLDRINRALRILQSSIPPTGEDAADANRYREAASAAYAKLCEATKNGRPEQIAALEEEMLTALNRYLLLSGKSDTHGEAITHLKQQKSLLLGTVAPTVKRNETRSGIFYDRSYVDGYEALFTPAALSELTPELFRLLRRAEPRENEGMAVGKLVYGYSWHAVMELPVSVAATLTVGGEYDVSFPENGGKTLTLTLERLEGGMAVFRSDDSPADFVYYRAQTAQITLSSEDGFYLPESALHAVEGKWGVYVLENSTARFRRVRILYRGDGYCIVDPRAEVGKNEVYLNDLIITSGKKLYDGKVYK